LHSTIGSFTDSILLWSIGHRELLLGTDILQMLLEDIAGIFTSSVGLKLSDLIATLVLMNPLDKCFPFLIDRKDISLAAQDLYTRISRVVVNNG
jgi:hypothetical protein